MSMSRLFIGFILFLLAGKAVAQIEVKRVTSNGGNIVKNAQYTSISVAGEMVIGRFEAGYLSGTFGYLDDGDSLVSRAAQGNITIKPRVYPNPNRGAFTVMLVIDIPGDAKVKLINPLGQVIVERSVQLIQGENKINFNNVLNGIFFIQIFIKDVKVETVRVIVE